MPWSKTPTWVLAGGAWLAFTAGFVNSVGFLGAAHGGVTHVTGQVTQVSLTLRDGNLLATLSAAAMVLAFFVGAVISGAIIRSSELTRRARPYVAVLLIEAACLFIATFLAVRGSSAAFHFVALASGMQNALATSYSGAVIRTTHMTGIVTDLGLFVGHVLRGAKAEWGRIKLLALLLFSFVFGGAIGAVTFTQLGAWTTLLPAIGLSIGGLAWLPFSEPAQKN
ncbi:MAG: DUF1275 domain-containing protein [Archangium sp.]|nr:DUF1275 domain-containing protein [Archangium sp.]